MGSQIEIIKDTEGQSHLIFDSSCLYNDSKMGENKKDFEVLRILSHNNNISKVRSRKNKKIYVLKKVNLNLLFSTDEEKEKNFYKQKIEKLKSLNHPHLLKYYKSFIYKT